MPLKEKRPIKKHSNPTAVYRANKGFPPAEPLTTCCYFYNNQSQRAKIINILESARDSFLLFGSRHSKDDKTQIAGKGHTCRQPLFLRTRFTFLRRQMHMYGIQPIRWKGGKCRGEDASTAEPMPEKKFQSI